MMVQGMQQKSHSNPPGQGHSTQPVLGAVGFTIDVVELLAIEDGSTEFTSSLGFVMAVMMDGWDRIFSRRLEWEGLDLRIRAGVFSGKVGVGGGMSATYDVRRC